MRTILFALIAAATVVLCVPATATANESAQIPACPAAETVPFSTPFAVWDRATPLSGALEMHWWEQWIEDEIALLATGTRNVDQWTLVGPSIVAPIYSTKVTQHFRWGDLGEGCYHHGQISVPAKRGDNPRMKFAINRTLVDFVSIRVGPVDENCSSTAVARGTVIVRRGRAKPMRRVLEDICEIAPTSYKAWGLGRGLDGEFSTSERLLELDAFLPGVAKETVTIEFRAASGYVQRARFVITRADRPDRKIWAGTDEYWNYCVNEAQEVYAENGNYYCWKFGRDSVKISKA